MLTDIFLATGFSVMQKIVNYEQKIVWDVKIEMLCITGTQKIIYLHILRQCKINFR